MSGSIYALLIACDFYFPNITEDETMFKSLKGCVRDITRIEEELLKGRLNVPPGNILKLKSSNTGAGSPPEPASELPTYENIIAKFDELINLAKAGDQVYIHYSGHGGRASTNFKELKGFDGIDETLVPINIEDLSTRYVRDIELARLFKQMVDKGLFLTVVVDSCHSGGMTRGGNRNDTMVRGVGAVDKRCRPLDSLVAGRDELIKTWQQMEASSTTRGLQNDSSGWLPDPKGYVLLAACRQDELATEYKFNGIDRCGALTYWLLDVLKQTGSNVAWKQIYDRIFAKITTQFAQTPQLQGEVSRLLFGFDDLPQSYAITVLQYESARNRLQLNTGEALGIAEGACFAVYPAGTTDFTQTDERLAVVEIDELGDTNSWAKIIQESNQAQFQGGEQAVLIDTGVVATRGQVHLIEEPPPPPTADREQALTAVNTAIASAGRGFLKTAAAADASNYQIGINEDRTFTILDPLGKPFPNLRPAISIDEQNAAEKVVERLVHLTRYHTIQYLKSPETLSPLAGKVTMEIFAAPADAKSDQAPLNPQPLSIIDGMPTVGVGERIYLNIRNDWDKTLNIAVLLLDSDWSINQVLPPKNLGQTITLEPGQHRAIWKAPRAFLPPGYQEGFNTFKVFAATTDASFRFLELPALDNPFRSMITRAPLNPLEQLLADYNADQPVKRGMEFDAEVSKEWTVLELTLKLIRR
ncbi:MAG TPA: caspase family protein [Pyrinomonadaceae bacterium]